LVFASEKTGRAFNNWGKAIDDLRRASGVTFTPHDLRRTCRTLMSRLGVEDNIAELAIGHKRTGLDAAYNLDGAWQRRCEAFEKVSDHIAKLHGRAAEEGKVVPMPVRADMPDRVALRAALQAMYRTIAEATQSKTRITRDAITIQAGYFDLDRSARMPI